MSSTLLFGRQVVVQFGTPGTTGKSFSDLRVTFRVQMSRSSTPNTGSIQIYNLNPDSIALLQKPDAVIRLLVGYDVPRLIFQGEPIKGGVKLERQGPDRILSIEAQDGGRSYREARIEVSFATQTTLRQVLDAVSAQLGLPSGTIRIDDDMRFPHGIVLSGSARDVLDRISRASGADWFVRDGVLQIVPTGGDTGEEAILFSVAQGNLIGSPAPTDQGIEVRGLIEPSMRPGRVFRVDSEQYPGQDYVATDVEFVGDAGWDPTFYVTVRGRPR